MGHARPGGPRVIKQTPALAPGGSLNSLAKAYTIAAHEIEYKLPHCHVWAHDDERAAKAKAVFDSELHRSSYSTCPEPATAPDTKRIKTAHNQSTEPGVESQAAPRVVPFPDRPAVLEQRNGEIEFRVVNNDGTRESVVVPTGLKCLFQKQLPKMPKDYIARLVYDRTHLSIAIIKKPLEVIGGISYRPFKSRKLAEIVFCAVSSDQRGFTEEITLDKALRMGYIKDYEGGTLMQCSMLPRIRYLEVGRVLLKQKEVVQAKIRMISKSHVAHRPPPQWASGISPVDPLSIPAIRATGTKEDEVPDYCNVIETPMDLSTMEERLVRDSYHAPRDFFNDLKLVFSNCRRYNDATTVYNKCAVRLEKYMWSLIKEVPEWFDLLEE
ncbi:histone acetyltransferase GCN5 [Metarhizium acridum CQMa 102]|uniref:Histone acetyltransferase GCN5 n=1 Tax=Metarhizium acridum (strain CQMa 102) TaxID=655827 RepID=E9E5H2_METAQ|nr:histone acetyltransferase GCN5 [Metarhizium acridum CQMa 102]EFY88855.1 histone acetyltransferase GCN5 [Metarhizium acridum CQMa 102]